MMSVASWLPSASSFLRPQAGVFRDQDDFHPSTLGYLAQLMRLAVRSDQKVLKPRTKFIKFRGVKDEINRATTSLGTLIQNTMSAIAELYNSNLSSADQDPELTRAEQSLIDLLSKLTDVSALRKQYSVIRNSGKRATLSTIGNIFGAILQRSRHKKISNIVPAPQLAPAQHKQIAKA